MVALAIESSRTRGMGHLFRALLTSDYMKQHGIEHLWLVNDDPRSLEVLKSHGIPYLIVDYHDDASLWEHRIIEEYDISLWLNDKFETPVWMAQHIRQKGIYLALIDDIGPGEAYADINFVSLISFSKCHFESENTRIGMEYAILNKEIEQYRHTRRNLNRIIVSFGGSDPYNHTIEVVRCLIAGGYQFDLTLGPNNACEGALRALGEGSFRIYRNVPSLVELFSRYDLAVTGGGITPCEANAAGLPCIVIASAPHEINTGRELEALGGCLYAGSYEGWDRQILLNADKLNLGAMSASGMKHFDTHALERIFEILKPHIPNRHN